MKEEELIKEFAKVEKTAKPFIESIKALGKVKSAKDAEGRYTMLTEVRSREKEIETAKGLLVNPLKDTVKNIQAMFKPLEEDIEESKKLLKDSLTDWDKEVKEKEAKKQDEIMEKVASGEITEEKASKKLEVSETKATALPTTTVSKMVIENPELVPDAYWVIDEVKLRKDLLAGIVVSGAKIIKEKVVR